MATIGFMTYDDFRNEIRDTGIKTVRLQDYFHRSVNSTGLPEVRYYVELAAGDDVDVYVCRFALGGGWDVGWDVEPERARRDRDQENVARAMEILRRDLEGLGLQVRPGVIAAAGESKIITAGEPWTWEKDDQGLLVLRQEE